MPNNLIAPPSEITIGGPRELFCKHSLQLFGWAELTIQYKLLFLNNYVLARYMLNFNVETSRRPARMSPKNILASACVAAVLTFASQASADVFNWSYVGGSGDTASGLMTVSLSSGDEYTVTGISGTYDGFSITGPLALAACCASPANDNLFWPNNDSNNGGLLDVGGIAFTANNLDINIFFDGSSYQDLTVPTGTGPGGFTSADSAGQFSAARIPEPITLSLFGAGLVGAAALRRHKKKSA